MSPQGIASVVAAPPPDGSLDIEAPAYALLNGSAINPMPSKRGDESAKLYALQRELKIVDRAIQIARDQASTVSIAASREVAAENLDQINAMHRQRALLLISLLKLNDKIERARASLVVAGIYPAGPMENYTARLFGTGTNPSPLNHWPRRYIAACLEAGVITKKDLEA